MLGRHPGKHARPCGDLGEFKNENIVKIGDTPQLNCVCVGGGGGGACVCVRAWSPPRHFDI